jgi:hypothetical protein
VIDEAEVVTFKDYYLEKEFLSLFMRPVAKTKPLSRKFGNPST